MKLKNLLIGLAALPLVACGSGKGPANSDSGNGNGGSSGPKVVNVVWGDVYSADADLTSYSQDGVNFVFDKATGQNAPVYKDNGKDARIYVGNAMTISSSSNISKIEFVINDYDTSKNGTMTASTGSLTGAGSDSYKATWNGSASSIKFTVTEKQKRMISVSVTLGEGSGSSQGGEQGGNNPGGGSSTATITAAKVAEDYAGILGFELEEDEYGYFTVFSLGSLSECNLQQGCEYAVAISPEYLYILSDVEQDVWEEGDEGYFASLCDEDFNVFVSIGTYAEGGECCVQLEIYDWTE